MGLFFPRVNLEAVPSMVFVDGENLAIRYGNLVQSRGATIPEHVRYEPGVYVWSTAMMNMMKSVIQSMLKIVRALLSPRDRPRSRTSPRGNRPR